MITINVIDRSGIEHKLTADPEHNLMELIRDSGIEIEAICGGGCSCATCHVYVEKAWLEAVGDRGDTEALLLETSRFFDDISSRLSCQIRCTKNLNGLIVRVAPED